MGEVRAVLANTPPPAPVVQTRSAPPRRSDAPPTPTPKSASRNGHPEEMPPAVAGGPGVAARDMLAVLAAFPEGLTRAQIALLTGRKPRGGSWNTALKQLDGLAHTIGDRLLITPAGRAVVPDVARLARDRVVARWRAGLPVATRELLDLLVAEPDRAIPLEELAERTGRAPRGGSWNTAVKALRESEIAVPANDGLQLTPDLALAAS